MNSSVKALTTSSNGANVYVGGDFTSAEGVGRQHLAAFNAVSGALATAFRPNVSNGAGNFGTVLSMDLSPDGRTLYFCGDFSHVNGSSRRNAAAVSSGVATLRAWSPSSTASSAGELTLSASGNTVFVAGRSTGGYVQAYGPINGGTPGWNVNTNGDVEALAVAGTTLYVGGHYTSIAGAGRGHLAAMRTRHPARLGPRRQRRLRRLRRGHHQLARRLRRRVHPGRRRGPPGRRPVLRGPVTASSSRRRMGTRLVNLVVDAADPAASSVGGPRPSAGRSPPPPPRRPRSNACSPLAPPRPTSARATSPGSSWPTRRATSSASCPRADRAQGYGGRIPLAWRVLAQEAVPRPEMEERCSVRSGGSWSAIP